MWLSSPYVILLGDGSDLVGVGSPLGWRDQGGREWWVPAGFVSDGASIPRWAWSFVGHPLTGRYVRAAILHDWQLAEGNDTRSRIHRRFYDALRADGVSWRQAQILYRAVQLADLVS